MRLLASALQEGGARQWIWAVVAGLVLSGALLGHAALMMFRALPEDVQANGIAAVRRRPRLLAVCLAVAAWTAVYMLYCLAYPTASILSSGLGSGAGITARSVAGREVTTAPFAGDQVSTQWSGSTSTQ